MLWWSFGLTHPCSTTLWALITPHLWLWGNARTRATFPTHKKSHNPHPQGEGGKGVKMGTLHWGGVGGAPAKPGSYIDIIFIVNQNALNLYIFIVNQNVLNSYCNLVYHVHEMERTTCLIEWSCKNHRGKACCSSTRIKWHVHKLCRNVSGFQTDNSAIATANLTLRVRFRPSGRVRFRLELDRCATVHEMPNQPSEQPALPQHKPGSPWENWSLPTTSYNFPASPFLHCMISTQDNFRPGYWQLSQSCDSYSANSFRSKKWSIICATMRRACSPSRCKETPELQPSQREGLNGEEVWLKLILVHTVKEQISEAVVGIAVFASVSSRSMDRDPIWTPCGRSSYETCQIWPRHLAKLHAPRKTRKTS